MKENKHSKRILIFVTVSFIILIGVLVATLVKNNKLREIKDNRINVLDTYELTKLWVIEDMRTYLSIKDDTSFYQAKDSVHFTSELKDILLGDKYNSENHAKLSNISVIDTQYTLGDSNKIVFYMLLNVKDGDKIKELNAMIFVANNMIYNILLY